MIQAHLTKQYGGKTAVNDLSLTVRPGVVTGFPGLNGAYPTGMIRATLSAAPRRLEVLWTKLGVFAVVIMVTCEAALFAGYTAPGMRVRCSC
jgi:ABC-type phosphonate transport system ATPase subunit